MQLVVVLAAERHSELVTYLSSQRSRLGDLQVVRVARTRLADEAWLRGDKSQVRLAALADRFRKRCDQRSDCGRQILFALC
jgi:hypothetical protein